MKRYGLIQVEWRRKEGDAITEVRIALPPNTAASVHLPDAQEALVRENGTIQELAAGISAIKQLNSGISLTLGSGVYHFTY